jgi:hypothetical protein
MSRDVMGDRLRTLLALGLLPTLPVVDSHYVPKFTVAHPRDPELQRAFCGQYVFAPERHSVEPSCPRCLAILQSEAPAFEGIQAGVEAGTEGDEFAERVGF